MRYQGIKVTLVTGFLGAGKTTLIRHLLAQSPPNERWAVLVNEFGDIGLDSAFYADLDVAISEVPGGCVCCTTSAAFQQGLNQLIRQYNPDRILIEPSGLGHPKQILQKLRSAAYQDVLLLTGAFCVLDARNLNDERYTKHDIFNDQIESADGIVLSHVDRYQQEDIDRVKARFGVLTSMGSTPTVFMSDPMALSADSLDIGLIDLSNASSTVEKHSHTPEKHSHHSSHHHVHAAVETTDQDKHWSYHKQQGDMQVVGWHWPRQDCFTQEKVKSIIQELSGFAGVYRIKGVFLISSNEALLVNVARGEVLITTSPWHDGSRLEIIGGIEGDWLKFALSRGAELL
ncbi:GTP-binding protein [Marinomonas rhizomae]|uniref:CobW family GTP-binding protein n=1 Tax=Marinomonas rhizomae TaxID=491948 RepID=UPI002107E0A0|nr:GTP-binding protein [Marinomonas rhizomae]UTV98247.1 GTP-binding protein [Marinomonas rhizomae]